MLFSSHFVFVQVAKASEALSLSLGGMASKRAQDQSAFAVQLQRFKWPSLYLREYLAAAAPRPREKTIFLCGLISNDKDGVPCAPKANKENKKEKKKKRGNRRVFVSFVF
jgi:hypothetical protein